MKPIIILLLSFSTCFCRAQDGNGWRHSSAQWHMSRPAIAIASSNNMVATSASSVGSLSVTDAITGWTLTTNSAQWEPYFGSVAHLTNGDGGASSGSPIYDYFNPNMLANGFLQAGHTFAVSGANYPYEYTNLPAGDYELQVISSIKTSVNSNLPNGIWYVRVGAGGTPTNQTISQQSNYTTPALIFTVTMNGTDHLFFGPFTSSEDGNASATVANCMKLKKKS